MRLIVYGLMLVFLTACGEKEQPDVSTSGVAPAGGEVFRVKAPAYKSVESIPATTIASMSTQVVSEAVHLPPTIEFKIATINAGHDIEKNDATIEIAKTYVEDIATKYHSDPDRAADICVKVFNMIQEKGHHVTLFDVFEAARAIRKDDVLNLTEKDLAEGLVAYSASRDVQNHTDSVVGLRKIFEFMDKK